MTTNLVVIINSFKLPKIKKILLYELKFLVPNYSCLQNPWLGDYRRHIPILSVRCPQLNLLTPTPEKKILCTPLIQNTHFSISVAEFQHVTSLAQNSKYRTVFPSSTVLNPCNRFFLLVGGRVIEWFGRKLSEYSLFNLNSRISTCYVFTTCNACLRSK